MQIKSFIHSSTLSTVPPSKNSPKLISVIYRVPYWTEPQTESIYSIKHRTPAHSFSLFKIFFQNSILFPGGFLSGPVGSSVFTDYLVCSRRILINGFPHFQSIDLDLLTLQMKTGFVWPLIDVEVTFTDSHLYELQQILVRLAGMSRSSDTGQTPWQSREAFPFVSHDMFIANLPFKTSDSWNKIRFSWFLTG